MTARESAGTTSVIHPVKSGRAGLGRPLVIVAMSETLATESQPKRYGRIDATMMATTRPKPRSLVFSQNDDEDDDGQPYRDGGEIDFVQVEEQIHGAGDLVGVFARVPGEVAQLAEDDENGHPVHEPDHLRVGHEAHEPAQLEEAGKQHDGPGEKGEGEEDAR